MGSEMCIRDRGSEMCIRDRCRELTRIKRDGAKIPYTNDQHSFNFNRMYDASNKDITLQLWFENSAYNTYLGGFRGTITITALD